MPRGLFQRRVTCLFTYTEAIGRKELEDVSIERFIMSKLARTKRQHERSNLLQLLVIRIQKAQNH